MPYRIDIEDDPEITPDDGSEERRKPAEPIPVGATLAGLVKCEDGVWRAPETPEAERARALRALS